MYDCEGLTSAKFGPTRRWVRKAAPKCGLTVLSRRFHMAYTVKRLYIRGSKCSITIIISEG